jgi:hypothetical protein
VLWAKSVEKKGACDMETEIILARHLLDEGCPSENP